MESIVEERHAGTALFGMRPATLPGGRPAKLPEGSRKNPGVPAEEVQEFLRQCSFRANSGLSVLEAMEVTAKEIVNPAFARVVGKVLQDLLAGRSISCALSFHPEVFPDLLVRYTRAGEECGCVERVWARFADHLQACEFIESKVLYVTIVGTIAYGVVLALLMFVLPQFQEIFAGMRIELPLPTAALLQLSVWLESLWYLVAPVTLYGPFFLWRNRHDRLHSSIRRSLMDGLPMLKSMVRKSGFARLARVLVMLLESRIPVVSAVAIAAMSSGNPTLERSAEALQRKIASGMRLTDAMAEAGIIPSKADEKRLSMAEDEGDLIQVLDEMAVQFELEGKRRFELFGRLIEPVVIVGMGLLIGGIVLSVFMPMIGGPVNAAD